MLAEAIGWPQIAALLVLLQRGAEELYSARNTRELIDRGRPLGRPFLLSGSGDNAPGLDCELGSFLFLPTP